MPASKDSIDRYLQAPVAWMPQFKHATPPSLHRSIYDSTGCHLTTKTSPRKLQLETLAFALYLRRALLYIDPQLGKSWVGLNYAAHLKRSKLWRPANGKGLVIAHSPLGLDVWQDQAAQHSDLDIRLVHLDFDDLADACESDCDLVVVPWSGLQSMFTAVRRKKRYPDLPRVELVARHFNLCIIDEIHMAMHIDTLRFRLGVCISQYCKFRLGLTGTPFGRNPYTTWSQAFLIDRGKALGQNYDFFVEAFSDSKPKKNFVGAKEYKFDKRKLPVLKDKLAALAMFYQRSEVGGDEVLTGTTKLRMSGDQLQAYREAVNKLVKLKSGETVDIVATFHRLRQISSGYLPYDDEGVQLIKHFEQNPKLRWLRDLMVGLDDKLTLIIFHEYTHTGELICSMLDTLKVSHGWLYGGTKDSGQVVRDFKAGNYRVLVANSAKGGMSISLPMADLIVFYESPVSPITRKQAENRPMSVRNQALSIEDLVCSGAERRVLDCIAEGRDLMALLTNSAERRRLADNQLVLPGIN